MSDFLSELAAKRQKYLEGLDANEGDINLDIFEDFYPDKAHFVFEILQNAEDAEASEVSFQLSEEGCLVEHDGKRLFDEADVRSITGIHNSTKKNRPDQIGKWGIGFKSVFVYTVTPEVHSGPYAFKIVRLIKPEPVKNSQSGPKMTRFWLPFNHPEKQQKNAFKEVTAGLRELSETALLFLSSVQSISWKIDASTHGEVLRIEHTKEHVEVLKQENGSVASSSHFLRFTRPADGLEKQNLAIAFNLEPLPNVKTFDSKLPLNKQARVVPAVGQVAVFFPAKRETSGLKFHVHIPGIPTPDRASIKDIPANDTFFEQLATVSVEALHRLKALGFLTREFLEVLPNAKDDLGNSEDDNRFDQIRASLVNAFNEQPLTPTFAKSHAPAKHLYQAKDALKRLVSDEDIEILINGRGVVPRWAANTDKEGTRIHRFMSGLNLRDWDFHDFLETISSQAEEVYDEPDEDFMHWLSLKSPEWLQEMYFKLIDEKDIEDDIYQLSTSRIVKLSDGSFSSAEKSYFPDEEKRLTDIVPCVDSAIFEDGNSKPRKKGARKFLKEIGVREIGERELVEVLLEKEYAATDRPLREKSYISHLRRFMKLAKEDFSATSLLEEYKIFIGDDGKWHAPGNIFIDRPYSDTGMSAYYDIVGRPAGVAALAGFYVGMPIDTPIFSRFVGSLGARQYLNIRSVRCQENPNWEKLRSVSGERNTSPLNEDYRFDGFAKLVDAKSAKISKLIWNTMCHHDSEYSWRGVLKARFRRNYSGGTMEAPSQLVHQLKAAQWVPQGDGFVRPAAARAELLPDGFTFDPGWAWIKAIEFGKNVELENEKAKAAAAEAVERRNRKEAAAAELGLDADDLFWLDKFKEVPADERDRFLQEWGRPRHVIELPDHEPRNPERRAKRVGEQASDAMERKTEKRTRSVSVGREDVKGEAAQYLQQQYSSDGEVICQVCKEPMPFKLDDGSVYFEKVEFLPDLKRRHHQNYLALCPNHAAMFQYANSTEEFMLNMFSEISGNELEVVLAQKNETIYFTKTHIADLKSVIDADQAQNDDEFEERKSGTS